VTCFLSKYLPLYPFFKAVGVLDPLYRLSVLAFNQLDGSLGVVVASSVIQVISLALLLLVLQKPINSSLIQGLHGGR